MINFSILLNVTGGVVLEIMTLFIIFLVGIFAGTINIVSAGGSLIVLPLLIFFWITNYCCECIEQGCDFSSKFIRLICVLHKRYEKC